jgi:hypothetical protein
MGILDGEIVTNGDPTGDERQQEKETDEDGTDGVVTQHAPAKLTTACRRAKRILEYL